MIKRNEAALLPWLWHAQVLPALAWRRRAQHGIPCCCSRVAITCCKLTRRFKSTVLPRRVEMGDDRPVNGGASRYNETGEIIQMKSNLVETRSALNFLPSMCRSRLMLHLGVPLMLQRASEGHQQGPEGSNRLASGWPAAATASAQAAALHRPLQDAAQAPIHIHMLHAGRPCAQTGGRSRAAELRSRRTSASQQQHLFCHARRGRQPGAAGCQGPCGDAGSLVWHGGQKAWRGGILGSPRGLGRRGDGGT